MSQKKPFKILFVILAFIVVISTHGAASNPPASTCKSEFPNLVSDICWRCMFPIRLGGNIIMSMGAMPDSVGTENPDDFNPNSPFCFCNDAAGTPWPGAYVSFWEPARVIEVVTKPNCFPFLFGLDMGANLNLFGVYGSTGQGRGKSDKAFYNVHLYTFPVMTVRNLSILWDRFLS